MRVRLSLAVLAGLVIALPAAAQSGGGGGGAGGGGSAGASAGGAAGATGVQGPTGRPSTQPGLPGVATSHAQTARRLMGRQGPPATGAAHTQGAPQVAAAAKAADQALVNDPTVKAMVDGSMAEPPSLAGGAAVPQPKAPPPQP